MDSDPSSDEETEKSTNAFDVLMQPSSKKAKVEQVDPIVIAVLYIRWLKWIDPSHPLFMCAYIGQAVRAGDTAEEVATKRWKEENHQAVREDKDIGLIHCLDVYGPDAFDDQIVEWKRGPRSEVQKYADEREIALIAENGGPFRNPSVRCKQTLNLTKGGKWGCSFQAIDSLRTVAWLKFKAELESYVECYETSLVPQAHVDELSGYKLGSHLAGVRSGELWKGHPDEENRVEWLQSLPKWAWDARETDEYKEVLFRRRDAFRTLMWLKFKTALDEYVERYKTSLVPVVYVDSMSGYRLGETLSHVRKNGTLWKGHPDEADRKAWLESLPKWAWNARETDECKDGHSKRAKKQFESQEARDELSKRSKAQAEREAADGMKSLAERGKGTSTANWTKEQYEAAVAKRKATTAAKRAKIAAGELEDTNAINIALKTAIKRAKVLQGLPEAERKTKEKEYAGIDLKEANRKGKAYALLKLPAYSDKGYQWCYRNQAQAKKDGVVFSKDANGVWSARVFERAGSSAEHGAHV